MKVNRNIFVIILSTFLSSLIISGLSVLAVSGQTQETNSSLQRGYSTGYSDGFMAGSKDSIESLGKEYSRHADYTRADRAYIKDYGSIDDYRDGYQQGFESGYNTGFDKRSFDANLPADLNRRGVPSNLCSTRKVRVDSSATGAR